MDGIILVARGTKVHVPSVGPDNAKFLFRPRGFHQEYFGRHGTASIKECKEKKEKK